MSGETAAPEGARRPRRREAAVWAVAAVLFVVLALAGRKASRYVQNDPRLCTATCHTVAAGKYHKDTPGHEKLACQACHQTSFKQGLSLLWRSARGAVEGTPAHSPNDAGACATCHESRVVEWRAIADTAGHHQHSAGQKPVSCLGCHAELVHSNKSPESICQKCHVPAKLHAKAHDADDCRSCHNFSAKTERAGGLTLAQCDTCHADPVKAKTLNAGLVTGDMLHGKVNCRLCHQPHREPGALARQPCNDCHEIQIGTEAAPAPEGHRVCVRCHSPHAPLSQSHFTCAKCHEQARKRETGPATTALRHDSCASCHRPHRWLPEPSGCMRCHAENAQKILTKSPEKHQKCTNCHEVHGPPPSGNICITCHKERRQHMATAPLKHRNCASCHDVHAAKELDVPRKACPRCHTGQVGQLMKEGPTKHQEVGCLGCHQPHNNPLPDQKKVCAKCHEDKIKAIAAATTSPAPHKVCTSCHQPHRFKIAVPANACGRCHDAIAKNPGNHTGTCTKCHNQHGNPLVTKTACLGCHDKIKLKPPPGNVQHANCGSCHKPHLMAKAAIDQCKTCHADKAAVAKLWPANSPHAGECAKCHNQHDVLNIQACGSCHNKQSSELGTGNKHKCTFCHQPHKAPASTKAEWWNRCQGCHSHELEDTKVGKHDFKCSKCHEQHKFARPKCTTCHGAILKMGAHQVPAHQQCTKCHNQHTTSKPQRKECVACHKDRVDHQPQATRCEACHLFK